MLAIARRRTFGFLLLGATALCGLSAVVAMPAAGAAASDTMKGLFAHRGIYELKLVAQKGISDISDAEGKLVYEFTGSVCEGFSTQFRFVTRLTSTEGQVKLSDMRTSSYEDAAGDTFDFVNQTYTSSVLTEDDKGSAARDNDGVAVTVSKPAAAKLRLPGEALFPTQHLAHLVEAAKAGKTVTEIVLYDGTDAGAKVYRTTSVIGKELPLDEDLAEEKAADVPALAKIRRWPVTISYFNYPKTGEQAGATPDYSLTFVLYENGVSRSMKLDYGDFVLSGKLVDFKPIEQKPCP
ncbi:MAG: cell envelope integrity EipB family protein [Ancalomicrobiaceae bacterium]|nr:cell envelope integrity EipB family protein [Ancalomicrobiaceae bacterium]